ncbi:hypothetical protein M3Y98_00875200 [Aphelenchoides besseyi]|nr:hypothetical protein M3Y98_00875200 [Aphelenchoides besseyi]
MGFGGRECVWLIFCFLMPPLAIFLNSNECNVHVAVNVVVLFFFLAARSISRSLVLFLPLNLTQLLLFYL